jgi:hypothetical protein
MGLFNRRRMRQAQSECLDIFQAIAGKAYQEIDPSSSEEDFRDLVASATCQVYPRWTLEEKARTLCRDGVAMISLSEQATAGDLLAAVIWSELKMRFSDLSIRDRIKIGEMTSRQSRVWIAQLEKSQLRLHSLSVLNPTASNPAHQDLLDEACVELRLLAEKVLTCGLAASVESQIMLGKTELGTLTPPRPLSALRSFVEDDSDWTLYDGELKLSERLVGRFSNEDELKLILLEMAQAVIERDYSGLNSEDRVAAHMSVIGAWDTAIDRIRL